MTPSKRRANQPGPPPSRAGRPRFAPRRRHDLTVDLGLVLTAVIWGLNFAVVKAVLREMEPLAFNALRFPCAAFAVWFLLKAQGRRLMPYRKDWRTVIALGTAGHVIFQVCFIYGLDLTLTGNAALLLSTTPVWVLLISVAVGRERFNLSILVGVLATLSGMLILVTGGSHEMGGVRTGDLLVLGAALSWSVYTVFSRRMTKRRGVLEMTAWTLWAGLPFIMLMGDPRSDTYRLGRDLGGSLARHRLRGCVRDRRWPICSGTGAYVTIGQSRTSVYQNLVPVVALAAAWLWLAETPTPQQLIGAAVILGGVVVARRSRRR